MRFSYGIAAVFLGCPALADGTAPVDWTGLYAGVQVGFGDAEGDGFDGDGTLAGYHVGYRYDFGRVVAGLEFDQSRMRFDVAGQSDSVDRPLHVKLSLGVRTGATLIYLAAGMARADMERDGETLQGHGQVVGVGAARAMTAHVSLGGEVSYERYPDFDGTGIVATATLATARLSYRF